MCQPLGVTRKVSVNRTMHRRLLSVCQSMVWINFIRISGYKIGISVQLARLRLKWTGSCSSGRCPVVLGSPGPWICGREIEGGVR